MANEFETERYTIRPTARRTETCRNGCIHLDRPSVCCTLVDARAAAWKRSYKIMGELPEIDAPGCPGFTPVTP